MTARVVPLDAYGTVDDVASGLGGAPVETTVAEEVPYGPGVVAPLAGPETPPTPDDIRGLPDRRILAVTFSGHDHVPVEVVAGRAAPAVTDVLNDQEPEREPGGAVARPQAPARPRNSARPHASEVAL